MKKTTKAGFTLIELMVVVAIITIILAIVIVSISSARVKGRDGVRKQNLSQISLLLERYYDENGHYPIPHGPNSVNTCLSASNWGCWDLTSAAPLFPTTYISSMPQDPLPIDTGTACTAKGSYLYAYFSDNGQRYILGTALENVPPASDPNYYNGNYGCTFFANWAITKGF